VRSIYGDLFTMQLCGHGRAVSAAAEITSRRGARSRFTPPMMSVDVAATMLAPEWGLSDVRITEHNGGRRPVFHPARPGLARREADVDLDLGRLR